VTYFIFIKIVYQSCLMQNVITNVTIATASFREDYYFSCYAKIESY